MAEALLDDDDDSFDMALCEDSDSLPSCLDSSSSSEESTTSDSSCERSEYKFRNRQLLKRVRKMNSRTHKRIFGMSKECFEKLHDDVKEELPLGRSNNGKSLNPEERLRYFLYKMRGNSFDFFDSFNQKIGEGTVCQNTAKIIEVLGQPNGFVTRHIFIPSTAKALRDAQIFSEIAGFPPIVWGTIDGCHIEVS